MQFHIDGRFHAAVRRAADGWDVLPAGTNAKDSLKTLALSAGLDAGDIDAYLDALCDEAAAGGQRLPPPQD